MKKKSSVKWEFSERIPNVLNGLDWSKVACLKWRWLGLVEDILSIWNIGRQGDKYLYINLACPSVCLFVCLYPINVKTAEPIGPKFFVGHQVTPGKVYGWSNFQKLVSIKIRFLKILKIHEIFFLKIREIFCFWFLENKFFTNEIKYRREAP